MVDDIGFTEISEVYRNERRSKTLTHIKGDFFGRASQYLARLKEEYSDENTNGSVSSAKAMMLQDEIKKVQKRLDQTYCHRERKISLAALAGVSGSEMPKYLTENEKKLYSSLVDILRHFRGGGTDDIAEKIAASVPVEERAPGSEVAEEEISEPEREEVPIATVQILEDIPSFTGTNRVYNLKKQDVVTLPINFADVLIARGAAKVIEG